MAAGIRPFHRATAIETLTAILQEEPPPLDLINPQVPETLRTIVQRCLAKDPEHRYHSTRDLARDLTELRDRPSSTAARPTLPRADQRGRPFALAAGALVLLVAAGAALWMARPRVSSVAASDRSIAILPFQNFGGRAEEDYFSDGMTESLITDLAKIKGLLVIARNSVFSYKNKNVDVRKVGEVLHVRYVLARTAHRAPAAVRAMA